MPASYPSYCRGRHRTHDHANGRFHGRTGRPMALSLAFIIGTPTALVSLCYSYFSHIGVKGGSCWYLGGAGHGLHRHAFWGGTLPTVISQWNTQSCFSGQSRRSNLKKIYQRAWIVAIKKIHFGPKNERYMRGILCKSRRNKRREKVAVGVLRVFLCVAVCVFIFILLLTTNYEAVPRKVCIQSV